jgi:hypothetical protein
VTEPTSAGPDEPTAGEPTDQERVADAAAPTPDAPAVPTPDAAEPQPTGEPAGGPKPPAVDPVERFRARHAVPSTGGSRGLWLAAVALVVALGALGATLWVQYLAHWSGFLTTSATTSTTSATPPGPSPQQVADAKAQACAAYDLANKAVTVSNDTSSNSEPAAATVNARLALAEANTYLLEHIDPATPPPLADALRRYAATVADLTTSLLAGIGTDDPAQAARIKDFGPLNDQIADLCK